MTTDASFILFLFTVLSEYFKIVVSEVAEKVEDQGYIVWAEWVIHFLETLFHYSKILQVSNYFDSIARSWNIK